MDKLIAYRKSVDFAGGNTVEADALVRAIATSTEQVHLPQLFARLADESGRIGWVRDSDYAAVALQAAASKVAYPTHRKAMLAFALERARWCASCATAGGEGLARSLHVSELEALVNKAMLQQ